MKKRQFWDTRGFGSQACYATHINLYFIWRCMLQCPKALWFIRLCFAIYKAMMCAVCQFQRTVRSDSMPAAPSCVSQKLQITVIDSLHEPFKSPWLLLFTTGVYIRVFNVLPTERISVLCMDLRTSSDFSVYSINFLIFVIETDCVCPVVEIGSLNIS
jgi:hypothetical protein